MQIGPCDNDEMLHKLLRYLDEMCQLAVPYNGKGKDVTFLYETFDFRMEERYRDKIDYTAAEVIGAMRMWAFERSEVVTLVKAGAGLGKGFWTDAKMKQAGLWVTGMKHAMDAKRHLLRYRAFKLNDTSLFEPFRPKDAVAFAPVTDFYRPIVP
jgi:hypothetical protein